jgi:phage terminase large subunit-like protein
MSYKQVVDKYVDNIKNRKTINCKEKYLEIDRYLTNLKDYELDVKKADEVINLIQSFFIHERGGKTDGTMFVDQPLILEPWQMYIIYNVVGLKNKETGLPKYSEAFIYVPRKQGKTTFITALMFVLGLLQSKNNSRLIITSASLAQSCISFHYLQYVLRKKKCVNDYRKKNNDFTVVDNNNQHIIKSTFNVGKFDIIPMASDVSRQDGENCNLVICDEIHAFREERQYTIFREATAVYPEALLVGITTAGDNINSFCYNHLKYCKKIIENVAKNESLFVFICKADEDEKGNVDYTNPIEHQKANPNYGITVNPEKILTHSLQAETNPEMRKNFLQKNLNVYTSSNKAYFNIADFRNSNSKHNFKITDGELKKLVWYGGVDLSTTHDLTAISLVSIYKDILLVWTHGFFPRDKADIKAKEDSIPFHGWQDDGNLTMISTPTLQYSDVIKKFKEKRKQGFNIKQIGYDVKFSPEFVEEMKKEKFKIINEPQLYVHKNAGFKFIEKKALDEKLYYFNSEAYEYCVINVSGIQKNDGLIQYEKVDGASSKNRIDYFDCSVFACVRLLNDLKNSNMKIDDLF